MSLNGSVLKLIFSNFNNEFNINFNSSKFFINDFFSSKAIIFLKISVNLS